ncbi:MAG: hypothetical protein JJ896_11090 [Rhodothermales bacterium]|nr:hypothetical protein [Rhodothermales bacterium]MBO6780186.1 hypothetical protein [Rhodothermales bacterium]
MKKPLAYLLVAAAVAIAVWMIAPRLIATSIPIPEGAPFTTGGVSVNPFNGTARLSDVTLLTQEPYEAPHVVHVPEITARVDVSTLMGSFIVVQEVLVRDAEIRIEQRGRNVNLLDVKRWVDDYLADADTTALPRVFVQEFRMVGTRGILHSDAGDRTFEMNDVVLRDLGSESAGTPVQVLAGNLLEPVLMEAIAEAGLGGRVRERLRGLLR